MNHAGEEEYRGSMIRSYFQGEKYQLRFSASVVGIREDLRRFGRVCVKRYCDGEGRALMIRSYFQRGKY